MRGTCGRVPLILVPYPVFFYRDLMRGTFAQSLTLIGPLVVSE